MKVDDMCFFEFELSQVTKVKDGKVTEISTGYMRTSTGDSFNDGCFPVSLHVKLISDAYDSWSKKLHKEGNNGLNYPDIHMWLVAHWAKTCSKREDDKWLETRYKELREFATEILELCKNYTDVITKSGIRLLR